jgi:hypothetical protein
LSKLTPNGVIIADDQIPTLDHVAFMGFFIGMRHTKAFPLPPQSHSSFETFSITNKG